MKMTGYMMLINAIFLFLFVGVNYAIYNSQAVEPGAMRHQVSMFYMWAVVPAILALLSGVYMIGFLARHRDGTFDPHESDTMVYHH
ncbi:MAG: hypothetical protein LC104_13720 [Bacteroidales bacterium]|nr:hypothetical protein [Bacteroidales bacterium]